ncbi:TrkA family potassium uptake protein [Haloferax sp. Atlit-10N]|uniref:Potassium uptake system protein n=1 Tax=Haloferax prahovense (strain DSM 18310 / JCM 13924 / TL6) TaxID=1227461 RepID=M0GNF2_HALPT|nr:MULTISPECIES: TrkA family potassium uptake protein [Haloferax]ELZ72414.1 potassium uptake system protein [Haloferax prahovense DSM 18310]MCO8266019.1 TrkA family potassium uptake protein [Haloferax sp. AB510]RDZ45935.1 TrkA family potassium uptake protein [Haloferax sp. Atlit-19N]RDZ46793.1 TrkA family potassium uptake protein [Haloferax sp. Atlit-16N]RDZ60625.1 TrkA family potassium uptake protein [Haloferax sp. Atlit-10N]
MPDPVTHDLRVVVAGGGELGLRTAELLSDRGHDVVIVEADPDRIPDVADKYIATVIEGDASRPEILRQAQPERSDVVAALTDDESTNFAICLAAQRMSDVRTVMRITGTPDELYEEFVDGLVFPERLGARAATNEIANGGVRTIEDIGGNVEIVEVEVAEDAPVAGKRLDEVRLPQGSLIIVDYQGNRIGGPDTVLEAGHRYVLGVESDVADEVMNLFRG